MIYSYSRLSTYDLCPYCFKLTYIDKLKRYQNAFAEYGLLIHEIFERYLRDEIKKKNLLEYYKKNYEYFVISEFPPFHNMQQTYYDAGIKFFKDIDFDIKDFEVLMIEDVIETNIEGISLVVKPDAVIKEKATGKIILLDYKTSKLYNNSSDNKKIDGYLKQMFLYSYGIWLTKDIAIDEIWIWFIRNGIFKKFIVDEEGILNTIEWIKKIHDKIQNDKEWKPNLEKSNKFFCEYICAHRDTCSAHLSKR